MILVDGTSLSRDARRTNERTNEEEKEEEKEIKNRYFS